MGNQQDISNSNGNGNGVFDDMTLKEAVKILLQEIADVRRELLGQMAKLATEIGTVRAELQALRMAVHQNQITFMKGHEDLERRLAVLEAKQGQ